MGHLLVRTLSLQRIVRPSGRSRNPSETRLIYWNDRREDNPEWFDIPKLVNSHNLRRLYCCKIATHNDYLEKAVFYFFAFIMLPDKNNRREI